MVERQLITKQRREKVRLCKLQKRTKIKAMRPRNNNLIKNRKMNKCGFCSYDFEFSRTDLHLIIM